MTEAQTGGTIAEATTKDEMVDDTAFEADEVDEAAVDNMEVNPPRQHHQRYDTHDNNGDSEP